MKNPKKPPQKRVFTCLPFPIHTILSSLYPPPCSQGKMRKRGHPDMLQRYVIRVWPGNPDGISHEASEARLLTKQGRERGHWGLWYHTNLQMGTRGPISCYPITKKVPSSLPPPPPPHFFPLIPPPSHPPLRNRRENRRCWDCIIASITVIIYTSILSYSLFFACYCNQSHQAWCVQLRHAKKCR